MDSIRVGKTFDVTSELIGDSNFSRPNLTIVLPKSFYNKYLKSPVIDPNVKLGF